MDLREFSGGSACISVMVMVVMVVVVVVIEEKVLGLGEARAGFAGRTAVGMRRWKSFDCFVKTKKSSRKELGYRGLLGGDWHWPEQDNDTDMEVSVQTEKPDVEVSVQTAKRDTPGPRSEEN